MFFRDNKPNVRQALAASAAAILGLIALTGCGSGDKGVKFGVHFPLPTCEKGNDAPVTFPPLATGQSMRIAEGTVGQDALKDGVVITPTGNGEFDLDKKNDNDTVGFRPEAEQAQFQSGDVTYDVASRFVEGRTAFTVTPLCPPPRS